MVARRRPAPKLTRGEANRVADDLARIESARAGLTEALRLLSVTIRREKHDRVREAFAVFLSEGGVTSTDWRAFVDGEPIRGCSTQRRHLRLVADNTETRPKRSRRKLTAARR
ncbi:hypothetical protein [Methyloligella solikamskensis]|uniref:Transposase n=1 Tax=Methyloligella solikamskensis TaxID=1177756 RepID=A0ABW3JBI1_9HYPH